MRRVVQTARSFVDDGRICSASICVRAAGAEVFHHTLGMARLDPPRPAAVDQPYDLASVTKAVAGSTVAAALVQAGRLDLDAPVTRWLAGAPAGLRVHHLLTHSSGFPSWNALYADCEGAWGLARTRDELMRRAWTTPLVGAPGASHCYTDIGFITLLAVLERAGEDRFDLLFRRLVQVPTCVEDLRWGWPRAAATEDCPVRGHVVEGVVHDLNCAALGGISTHAGLFGTARAVAEIGEAFVDAVQERRRLDFGAALRGFWATTGAGSHRAGWDGVSSGYTSTGRYFPAHETVGHLGYTGTSLWIVPSRRTVVALLTNRVHPVDDKTAIRAFRPLLHDAVAVELGWAR